MASSLHIHSQLEKLTDDLDGSDFLTWLREGKPEEVADIIAQMAEVASTLSAHVRNFMVDWDFTEDCRRAAKKKKATKARAES